MTITDVKVKQMLAKVRSGELEEDVENYPDNERDGRSDMQFFADEVSYIVSLYHENETIHREDLQDAKALLAETDYGKRIPLDARTLKPKRGYYPSDIQTAKDIVNEYNRLVRLNARLRKMGYYGKW